LETIKSRTEELTKTLQEIGAEAYKQAAQPPPAEESKEAKTKEQSSRDKVVDADFKVVDEDKK